MSGFISMLNAKPNNKDEYAYIAQSIHNYLFETVLKKYASFKWNHRFEKINKSKELINDSENKRDEYLLLKCECIIYIIIDLIEQ